MMTVFYREKIILRHKKIIQCHSKGFHAIPQNFTLNLNLTPCFDAVGKSRYVRRLTYSI